MPNPLPDITLASRLKPSTEALVQQVGDEAIVLDITGERYYGLNEIGMRLWALLSNDPSLGAAHAVLLGEYEVSPSELERDLLTIATQLSDAGLVRIV